MLTNQRRLFFQKGQSLLEIVFSTTVVALVLTAIAASMTMSLKISTESKYRSYANFYSQEAMEFFKRERVKLGWAEFRDTLLAINPNVCILSLPSHLDSLYTYDPLCSEGEVFAGTQFTRSVAITQESADKMLVVITVKWYDGNQEKEVNLDGVFKDN